MLNSILKGSNMDSIFRNAAVVLILVNKDRIVLDINKSGEIYTGKRRAELLGLLGGQAINCINSTGSDNSVCGSGKDCGSCKLKSSIEKVFTKGESTYKEEGVMRVIDKNNKPIVCNILISCSPIHKKGETMALVTLDDITEQKKIERKLKDLNAMKDRMFSILAHDLSTHFNIILGYSELLMNMGNSVEEIGERQTFIKYLHSSSRQAHFILENLLTWARMQMNHIPFKLEHILLNELIEESIELYNFAAQAKNMTITLDSTLLYEVVADKFMVTTVIQNILSNALKFSNEGDNISIVISHNKGGFVKVEIKDSGIGMSDEVINKLFKVEENYSSVGTAGEKGTGIGLIICKDLIQRNKGKIGVESELGKGSTFWFLLPIIN